MFTMFGVYCLRSIDYLTNSGLPIVIKQLGRFIHFHCCIFIRQTNFRYLLCSNTIKKYVFGIWHQYIIQTGLLFLCTLGTLCIQIYLLCRKCHFYRFLINFWFPLLYSFTSNKRVDQFVCWANSCWRLFLFKKRPSPALPLLIPRK